MSLCALGCLTLRSDYDVAPCRGTQSAVLNTVMARASLVVAIHTKEHQIHIQTGAKVATLIWGIEEERNFTITCATATTTRTFTRVRAISTLLRIGLLIGLGFDLQIHKKGGRARLNHRCAPSREIYYHPF